MFPDHFIPLTPGRIIYRQHLHTSRRPEGIYSRYFDTFWDVSDQPVENLGSVINGERGKGQRSTCSSDVVDILIQ